MHESLPYVITISRQFGCGGAYLGQRLATRLNILYLDHEIVHRAAQELKISEEYIASRDEKIVSAWQSVLQTIARSPTWVYAPPTVDAILHDEGLFNIESDIITRVSNQQSAVIVGRGGCYVLRKYPRCLNMFLHADIDFRRQRVQDLYHISKQEALKLITSIDQGRARYLRTFTGRDWLDACQYHLSLDTGAIGLEKAEAIILEALHAQFSDVKAEAKK